MLRQLPLNLRVSLGAALAAAACAACASPAGVPGEARLAVLDGEPAPSDEAVVSLFGCSGVLVAPGRVLTAAHCLENQVTAIHVGATHAGKEGLIAVKGARLHPDYDPESHAFDLALLELARDPGIVPLALPGPSFAFDSLAGEAVRAIGYSGGPPTSRTQGRLRVDAVHAYTLELSSDPARLCHGDSGGPILARVGEREVVAGIVSHGDPDCAGGANAARSDEAYELIAAAEPLVETSCALTTPPSGRGLIVVAAWLFALLVRRRRPTRGVFHVR